MTHTDNGWEANGMPRDNQPYVVDVAGGGADRQFVSIDSGIIDVPDNGGRGFKLRARHSTGQNLDFTQGWASLEFVE